MFVSPPLYMLCADIINITIKKQILTVTFLTCVYQIFITLSLYKKYCTKPVSKIKCSTYFYSDSVSQSFMYIINCITGIR